MNIYEFLALRQRKTPYQNSEESIFLRENIHVLSNIEHFEPWMNPRTPFEAVRTNIVIRSLINKNEIEGLYESYARHEDEEAGPSLSLHEFMLSGMSELPYLLFHGEKIYVPFFPSSLNTLYASNHRKLGEPPYKRLIRDYEAALVDPFDYYGTSLFDSYFTRLVPIARDKGVLFAYDYDAECCYAINSQGRLDSSISLFDVDLESVSKAHMAERLAKLSRAYFGNDRGVFYRTLVSEKLVSAKCIHDYLEKIGEDSAKIDLSEPTETL